LLKRAKLTLIGHFLEGDKNGRGVFHDSQEDDYEEEWVGGEMFRRTPVSPTRKNSSSAGTNFTAVKKGMKIKLTLRLNYGEIESKDKAEDYKGRKKEKAKTQATRHVDDDDDEIVIKSSPKSEGNMEKYEGEATTSDKENLYTGNPDGDKEYDDQKFNSNILFKSQNDFDSSEGKVYDVGFETLNVIEHMEMLNSVAGTLLNKDGKSLLCLLYKRIS